MYTQARRNRNAVNVWPGFVDALASILLVFVFMLLLFVLGQFLLTDVLIGRTAEVKRLHQDIDVLTRQLTTERDLTATQSERISELTKTLETTISERDRLNRELELKLRELASLQEDIVALREVRKELEAKITDMALVQKQQKTELTALRDRSKKLEQKLSDEEERTRLAQMEIDKKDIRLQELRELIAQADLALAQEKELVADQKKKLQQSQAKVAQQRTELDRLNAKLNRELAKKVKELSRYRSEFFGRLRTVLGEHPDIRIVGDRFLFQSELLFASGSADLGQAGRSQLKKLAATLKQVSGKIPPDINWILRVDGHTDKKPINTDKFPSNWELSTARALSIVRFLVAEGIEPERLAATGFGEFHPLDTTDSAEAYSRNRRIELKLTER